MDDNLIIQRESDGVSQICYKGKIEVYKTISLLIYKRCCMSKTGKDTLILGIDNPEITEQFDEIKDIKFYKPNEYTLQVELYI